MSEVVTHLVEVVGLPIRMDIQYQASLMEGARGSLMQLAFSARAWSVYLAFLRYLQQLETEGALLLHIVNPRERQPSREYCHCTGSVSLSRESQTLSWLRF